MNILLALAFLFFIGSLFGWVLELFYRRFFSAANPERKWINPGFCTGPWLPLYGSGLCILFLTAIFENKLSALSEVPRKIILFAFMAVMMTVIEYIAGYVSLRFFRLRLWDYRNEWGNIQGIICPKFSLIWALMGAAYYFLIHPHILEALSWLSRNLAFSFFIGAFFGLFTVDVVYSSQLIAKIKKFADENGVVVKYEQLKAHIRSVHDNKNLKSHFFLALRSERSLSEHLKDLLEQYEKQKSKINKNNSENFPDFKRSFLFILILILIILIISII